MREYGLYSLLDGDFVLGHLLAEHLIGRPLNGIKSNEIPIGAAFVLPLAIKEWLVSALKDLACAFTFSISSRVVGESTSGGLIRHGSGLVALAGAIHCPKCLLWVRPIGTHLLRQDLALVAQPARGQMLCLIIHQVTADLRSVVVVPFGS